MSDVEEPEFPPEKVIVCFENYFEKLYEHHARKGENFIIFAHPAAIAAPWAPDFLVRRHAAEVGFAKLIPPVICALCPLATWTIRGFLQKDSPPRKSEVFCGKFHQDMIAEGLPLKLVEECGEGFVQVSAIGRAMREEFEARKAEEAGDDC